jgi:maltooligosyltrehalose synthase
LPAGCEFVEWQDVLSHNRLQARGGYIVLAQALSVLPVALLCPA